MFDKSILNNLTYGVYIISSMDKKRPTGCVVNSIMQISYTSIAASVNRANYTNSVIKQNGEFAISILPENIDNRVIPVFGFQTGRNFDKFQNIEYKIVNNLPVVKDAIGYLTLKTTQTIEVEEHTLFIAEITGGEIYNKELPMTYKYYHEVLKGTSSKAAPTHVEEKVVSSDKKMFKCSVCGYIYEGDISKEAPNFICPVCRQPKTVFEEISHA